MDWNLFLSVASILAGGGTFIGSLVWWLAGQFKLTRDLIYKVKEEILDKLEYHERHDDTRFQNIRNDVWDIRVRNAAIDGLIPLSSREKD